MRKPLIYRLDLGDENVWWCTYEDDESTQNWLDNKPDPLGNGNTPEAAYQDFLKKFEEVKS